MACDVSPVAMFVYLKVRSDVNQKVGEKYRWKIGTLEIIIAINFWIRESRGLGTKKSNVAILRYTSGQIIGLTPEAMPERISILKSASKHVGGRWLRGQ